jgi:hypothetical protein
MATSTPAPVDTAQQPVIAYLSAPATHGGVAVERIDTHSAIVFLAGGRALKLKRAVRFDYLDFSTAERRRIACEAEVRINRRTAPSLYRGVVAVTRARNGTFALDGSGTPVDWLVDMVRFDQAGLFDRLAETGALDLALMRPLADRIAQFHEGAERRGDHGGRAGMDWVVTGNAEGLADQGAGIVDPLWVADLTARARAAIEDHSALLDERRHHGQVRQCHGDLHLRNLVLIDGAPVLFDAIEFNDDIACVDVLYDLAFLLMDLWRRDLRRHANEVWNGYLAATGDQSGLGLLPLFLSCRAGVRAKTSATAARLHPDPARARELEDLARAYLTLALDFLDPAPPRLVAVGGFSGSGKSTLARALAPGVGGAAPGAVVVRSDEIRKSLCGVPVLEHLGPEGYGAAMNDQVYQTMVNRTADALRAGHSVVVDAVFARPVDRAALEGLAAAAHTRFVGLWLDAPPSVLTARAESRGSDASDADAAVVRQQLQQGTGPLTWHRLDAEGTAQAVLTRALATIDTEPTTRTP